MQSACVLLPSVACPSVPYFSTLSHERYDFQIKLTERRICVLIFATIFVKNNFSFQEKSSDILSQICLCLHLKYPLLFSDFIGTCIFSTGFRKIHKCHENRSSESRVVPCWRTNGRTDGNLYRHNEANSRFFRRRVKDGEKKVFWN
jgi:hypothetical protein